MHWGSKVDGLYCGGVLLSSLSKALWMYSYHLSDHEAVFATAVDASVVVEDEDEEEADDVCCCCGSAWLEELWGASGGSIIIDPPPASCPSARISLMVSGAEE